jgi:type IV pilus assembly protein PilM
LTPEDKAGVLSKLHTISFGRRPFTPAWGLDLSANGLKAIKLVREQEHARVEACLHVPPARPIANSANETERAELVTGVLNEFVRRVGELRGVKVVMGIAGHRVLGRFFELPPLPVKKIADAVLFEAKHLLPMALEALCWSYAIESRGAGQAADDQPRRVMLQACRESYVRERIGLFKAAGIHVDRVQSDCVALHNALVYESALMSPAAGCVAAVDCGSEETNLVVCSTAGTWFRTFGIGGDPFARQLVKQLGVTAEQAQRLLHEPARARRFSRWHEALAPLYVQLASEIERSLATHRKLYPDRPIRQIYGLGGAFQTFGVLRQLRMEA